MPHLSPLNWLFTPIIMFLVLLALMMIMWWHITPCFPPLSSATARKTSKNLSWW
nr:ATP synthase F0 subunit 8 [Nereididae sp. SIO BIC A9836]